MIERIEAFFNSIQQNPIELYNEAGLQYELAIFLRNNYPDLNVKLEFPVSRIFQNQTQFLKKEMDLFITSADGLRYVVELKAPLGNSGVPNAMYKALEDVKFLEQLSDARIDGGFSILATPAPAFWNAPRVNGMLYQMFNGDTVNFEETHIEQLPAFLQSKGRIDLNNYHEAPWQTLTALEGTLWKYYIITV
ncbi:hypothetical protein SAMN04488104_102510 [Algoriphagus faecimaris]|uniref:Uncharacterized protein n=1 Tax=Algoriphagus faecimaris TaxID=686796 RepID=A0A1G6TXP6_9BACT|nr:hypothetical protein [Algoriphagus faecimaris]SDD33942.1 hypothetical protein SAMN04488104_102510 [Algoriphagus faecimaris]